MKVWKRQETWLWVVLAWISISVIWTPAVILIGPSGSWEANVVVGVMGMLFVNFAPWAASAPLFHWLGRRLPIGLKGTVRSVLVLLLFSIIFVPAVSGLGFLTNQLFLILVGAERDAAMMEARAVQAIFINGLFAFPTYAAMVAIGQTIAFIERYRERERSLSEARDEIIKAQIAPHFLFNALNALSELEHGEAEIRDDAIVRLARLLRRTLERPATGSLGEELDYVEDFLGFHKLLLGERLRIEIKTDGNVQDYSFPSFALQPVVENAIRHGVSRMREGGEIHLNAQVEPDHVIVTVSNDIPSPSSGEPGTGRGLSIARHRLASMYGDRAELKFSVFGSYAESVIRLPREGRS